MSDAPAKEISGQTVGVNNTNSGQGQQTNLTQSGSNNWQVNAQTANIQVTQVAPPTEDKPSPSSTALPRHDPHFIERQELFQQIEDRAAVPGNWLALVGLGGVGKTQLATRYVKNVREKDKDVWILWIFASHAIRFDESVRDLADQIKLPNRENPQENVLQLLQTWLADSSRRWLLVLDNADETAFLDDPPATADNARATKPRIEYLQHGDHGTIMLTSRSKDEALKFVSEDNIIEVRQMDSEHAKQLLKLKLLNSYIEPEADKLAAALDYMPLALSQAASFIMQKKRTYSIERYLTELEKSRESRTSLLRQQGTMPRRDRDASSSIMATWQISFEHIYRDRKSAADLLALMSFCDRQAIPEFLLRGELQTVGTTAIDGDSRLLDDDIQMLEDFSFIATVKESTTTFEMHRLVQDATQWWLSNRDDKDEFVNSEQKFISHLYAVMPAGQFGTWDTCRVLMPHVESAMQLKLTKDPVRLQWASIAFRAAWYQGVTGRLAYADEIAQLCLQNRVQVLGEDHKETLEAKNGIASLRVLQGRFREAERLAVGVIQSQKKMLGDEDPITLESMHNLATAYVKQARLEEAEVLTREVLAKRTKLFTEENFNTTSTMNLLAMIHFNQGRLEEARLLQKKALDISMKLLGKENPETLVQLHNLAVTTHKLKRLDEAEKIQEESMGMTMKVLGKDHPQTLLNMGNLAVIIRDLGRSEEAAAMQMMVAEKREKVLGRDHPDTLTSMNLVAQYHSSVNEWSEAAGLLEKVLEARKRVLGTQHPETVRTIDQLAKVRMDQLRSEHRKWIDRSDVQEQDLIAATAGKEQIDIFKTLSLMYAGHGFDTIASRQHIWMLTEKDDRPGYHEELAKEVGNLSLSPTESVLLLNVENLELQIRQSQQDIEAELLRIMSLRTIAVAMLLCRTGRHEWTEKFAEPSIHALRTVLEEGHPDTMRCIGAMSYLYDRRGDQELALAQIRIIQEINARVLAAEDQTAISEPILAWHRQYHTGSNEREASKAASTDDGVVQRCSIQ